MAVELNMSNYRADYTISDAAASRASQGSTKNEGGFAKLLDNLSAKPVEVKDTVQSSKVESTYSEPFVEEAIIVDKIDVGGGTLDCGLDYKGPALPDDDWELARMIVNGDINLKDVPPERLTIRLLKLILLAKFQKKKDEDEKALDPEEEGQDQTNPSKLIDLQLAMLELILNALANNSSEENRKVALEFNDNVREIMGLIRDGENEVTKFDLMAMLTQLINDKLEVGVELKITLPSIENSTELPKIELESSDDFLNTLIAYIGEDKMELLEEALENGDIVEITKLVKGFLEEDPVVEPAVVKPETKSAIAEELEMLRNAKQKRTDESEFSQPVKVDEENTEAVQATAKDEGANSAKSEDGTEAGLLAQSAQSPIIIRTESGEEIEVFPTQVVDQAMKVVEQALEDAKAQSEYSLELNPGELGRITVKMVKAADGAVSVTIAAENVRTQRILEENSSLMQSNLRSNGVQLESWQTVNESQQETLAQDYNGSSKNPYYHEEKQSEEDNPEGISFAELIAAM